MKNLLSAGIIVLSVLASCDNSSQEEPSIPDDCYLITYNFDQWVKDNPAHGKQAPFEFITLYSDWQKKCNNIILSNESATISYEQAFVNQGYSQGIWFYWAINDTVASMIQTEVRWNGIECKQLFYRTFDGIPMIDSIYPWPYENPEYKYINDISLFPAINGNLIEFDIAYREELFAELELEQKPVDPDPYDLNQFIGRWGFCEEAPGADMITGYEGLVIESIYNEGGEFDVNFRFTLREGPMEGYMDSISVQTWSITEEDKLKLNCYAETYNGDPYFPTDSVLVANSGKFELNLDLILNRIYTESGFTLLETEFDNTHNSYDLNLEYNGQYRGSGGIQLQKCD